MTTQKQPSALVALIPIVALMAMLFAAIRLFGSDAVGGASQICLIVTSGICVLLGMWIYKVKWIEFEKAIVGNVSNVGVALFILLIIGVLSGVWMLSGVVPTLIYYGLQIIHPNFFLLSACLICAIVAIMTGSSWTTIATIGLALMGIGRVQGFSDGWIAGAVISGAYFGDKISPLSDTTVLASSVSGTPLFTHIRYMLLTTVPSLLIALAVFTVAGLMHTGGEMTTMMSFTEALLGRFNITPWLLIVPVVTGILIAKRIPTLITLFLSSALAAVFMLFFQPEVVQEIAGDAAGTSAASLKGTFISLYGSTSLVTDNPELSELIATHGMAGMLSTVWLIMCAMCFGGAMTAGGMLGAITKLFVRFTHRLVSMVGSTVGCGLFLNACTADQYMSIILTSKMFKDIYDENGYETRLLSRTTEDSVTVTSVLFPWNTCGLTQATVLGVPTIAYLPYCVFNYISPLMSICMSAIGFRIFRRVNGAEGETLQPVRAIKHKSIKQKR